MELTNVQIAIANICDEIKERIMKFGQDALEKHPGCAACNPDVKKLILKLSIPVANLFIQMRLERECMHHIEEGYKAKNYDIVKIWLVHKNQIKRYALVGYAIHALFFLGTAIMFPLTGSFLASASLLLLFKNLVNISGNKTLMKNLDDKIVIVGDNQKIPRGKTAFALTSVE